MYSIPLPNTRHYLLTMIVYLLNKTLFIYLESLCRDKLHHKSFFGSILEEVVVSHGGTGSPKLSHFFLVILQLCASLSLTGAINHKMVKVHFPLP